MNDLHVRRVKEELRAKGVTLYGLAKSESKELPRILHQNEHIGGVVYGQAGGGSSAMLIATDLRVIFLDHRPFFTTTDELTYDVVSGVRSSTAGIFTSVVLHTRIRNYSFRYVNTKCANIFVSYIESKRLEKSKYSQTNDRNEPEVLPPLFQNISDKKAVTFLKAHDLAVLSTVDRTGNVHGAMVYYLVDQNNFIYILTKSDTGKGRNVYAHSQIALTVHEPGTMQTLQIQGTAEVETDQKVKDMVFTQLVKPRVYKTGSHLPPVTSLQEGSFMAIKITVSNMSYHDYAVS